MLKTLFGNSKFRAVKILARSQNLILKFFKGFCTGHRKGKQNKKSVYGPVFFDGSKKREICKGEIGFHFLEAHSSSRVTNLMEVCHKSG